MEKQEKRIIKLERVFKKIDEWIEIYKHDKEPIKRYPESIRQAVKEQVLVVLKDLRSVVLEVDS